MSTSHITVLEADAPLPLKSTFNFIRNRARPPPVTWYMESLEDVSSSQRATKLAHRESKGGLRSIFSRNKVNSEGDFAFIPPKEDSMLRGRSKNQTPPVATKEDVESGDIVTQPSAESSTSAGERRTGLRMSMMPKPKATKPVPKPVVKQPAKSTSKPLRRSSAAWDPPPLFQAYPQAIKHAQLASSTLSADSILRVTNHKRSLSIQDETAKPNVNTIEVVSNTTKKPEKLRSNHRRKISGSSSKSDWTEKIYVLVTSGYLLQYTSEGSFDRLPEKMMQLGKDSVAFASDVIPGKHWVLQISQAMDAEGVPAPDSRSLLSRLTFRGADYRRNATSLLLILDSAEELESWITTVRREIEALGGKKYVSETGKPKAEEEIPQLREQLSQRYLIKRDPDRFSTPSTPRSLSANPSWRQSGDATEQDQRKANLAGQDSIGPPSNRLSVATSSASHDSQQLEALRDSSYRLSYMSSGQRTLVTSQGSSPACSPTQDTFATFEESHVSHVIEEIRPRPNATAISERRRSMQTMHNSALDFQAVSRGPQARPHSTYGGSGRNALSSSLSTPNFSVPHSIGKRYTLAKTTEGVSIPPSTRPKTPIGSHDSSLKGNRKSPPTPLMARPLSPVIDSPSPVKQPAVYTPSGSDKVSQKRPSATEIPTRTPTSSPPKSSSSAADSSRSLRRVSLTAPKSPNSSHSISPSTRRYSSIQSLPHIGSMSALHTNTALEQPLPPHMIPLPPSPRLQPSRPETRATNSPISPATLDKQSVTASYSSRPRRPASMQVLSQAAKTPIRKIMPPPSGKLKAISPTISQSATPSRSSLPPTSMYSTPKSPPISSPIQRLKIDASSGAKKDLLARRSMPHLVNGPPPAPPPNCALPPIPAGMRSPLAMKSGRNGVKV